MVERKANIGDLVKYQNQAIGIVVSIDFITNCWKYNVEWVVKKTRNVPTNFYDYHLIYGMWSKLS